MKLEDRITKLEQEIKQIYQTLQRQPETSKTGRRISHQDNMAVRLYSQTLGGLSNPIRIAILDRLAEKDSYYRELEKLTGISSAPLNFHLKTLKSSGLICQDVKRGKYSVTELGLRLLELIDQMAKALYDFETVELDRYCFLCSEAQMKLDVFPTHLRIWCPKCGGDHGSSWSFTLLNVFGEEWRQHDIEKLIETGWNETFKLIKNAIRSSRCMNCNAQTEYVFHDDRIDGKCPLCGQHYSVRTNDLTPDRLFSLWKKHKKIRQKTEGPVEKEGVMCWRVSVSDDKGAIIAEQYIKIGEGVEVAWREFQTSD
jgi:DNA-binding HxlR family transcriptional regulator